MQRRNGQICEHFECFAWIRSDRTSDVHRISSKREFLSSPKHAIHTNNNKQNKLRTLKFRLYAGWNRIGNCVYKWAFVGGQILFDAQCDQITGCHQCVWLSFAVHTERYGHNFMERRFSACRWIRTIFGGRTWTRRRRNIFQCKADTRHTIETKSFCRIRREFRNVHHISGNYGKCMCTSVLDSVGAALCASDWIGAISHFEICI